MEQNSDGKIFCFNIKFLNFSETKKFSTESFLSFRELQPLVSYKWVSYKKNTCTFIQESCLVVFKHFSVSLAARVINFHLEHSFYIDIDKNIISYFNTVKMLFVLFLPVSCKKNETSLIFYTFLENGQRISGGQGQSWVGILDEQC